MGGCVSVLQCVHFLPRDMMLSSSTLDKTPSRPRHAKNSCGGRRCQRYHKHKTTYRAAVCVAAVVASLAPSTAAAPPAAEAPSVPGVARPTASSPARTVYSVLPPLRKKGRKGGAVRQTRAGPTAVAAGIRAKNVGSEQSKPTPALVCIRSKVDKGAEIRDETVRTHGRRSKHKHDATTKRDQVSTSETLAWKRRPSSNAGQTAPAREKPTPSFRLCLLYR